MYTLVLMTAMSSAPDTAEFNGFFRRLFSFGGGQSCCGGSCTGSGYGSCTGSRLRAYTSCCGGTGRGYSSCSGSSLSAGSCTGSGYLPCSGGGMMTAPMGMDPGFAVPAPATSSFFAYPSYYPMAEPGGCWGNGAGGMGLTPTIPPVPGLGQPFAPTMPASPDASVPDSRGTSFAMGAGGVGRATVVVKLPADAVLFAEGRRLILAGAERTFTTPPLPNGDWGYTFRAEYTRDGETISRSKRVGVKPGDALVLEFTETGLARTTKAEPKPAPTGLATATVPTVPTVTPPPLNPFVQQAAPAASQAPVTDRPQPATLTIKVPPGATLTVDGKRVDKSGDYRTPPLTPGREYSYQVQTEEMKDGQPLRTTSRVPVRAGELVVVGFPGLTK